MHPVILLLLRSVTTDCVWLLIFTRFLNTHNEAPQSVGLLWTSNQFVAETSTWQHTTVTTYKHPCPPKCWGFLFTLKNPTASARFEPANLGTKGQQATSRQHEAAQTGYKAAIKGAGKLLWISVVSVAVKEFCIFVQLTFKYMLTYLLTPWSRVLLEKLTSKLCR